MNKIFLHLVKLFTTILGYKWSLTQTHLKICGNLESFISHHNAWDFLLMWVVRALWQMVDLQVGNRGVLVGGRRTLHYVKRSWCNSQDRHSIDLLEPLQGLSLHARIISAIPSLVLPFLGSHSCLLLLADILSRRAVFIPSKTPRASYCRWN